MQLAPVTSSNIAAVGYDAATRELTIQFLHGGFYKFMDVPAEVAAEFTEAKSVGGYFAKHIRGKFEFSKIVPQEVQPE